MKSKAVIIILLIIVVGIISFVNYSMRVIHNDTVQLKAIKPLKQIRVLDDSGTEPITINNTEPVPPSPPPDPDVLALQIFDKVNQARVQAGVSSLVWNGVISTSAKQHSQDMMSRHYFAHVSPDNIDPAQRGVSAGFENCGDPETIKLYQSIEPEGVRYDNMLDGYFHAVNKYKQDQYYYENFGQGNIGLGNSLKIQYDSIRQQEHELQNMNIDYNNKIDLVDEAIQERKIGTGFSENIMDSVGYSYDSVPDMAIRGWLDSPGHREVMLHPYFSMMGMGVVIDDSTKTVMVTNDFC